jgi:hypothetical protein
LAAGLPGAAFFQMSDGWWSMDQVVPSRLERLQAGATKNEQDLARLRQRIDDLRVDGQRTTEAEAVFERFEATHQGLLAKLDTLRRKQTAGD